jgi:hypothetical protein
MSLAIIGKSIKKALKKTAKHLENTIEKTPVGLLGKGISKELLGNTALAEIGKLALPALAGLDPSSVIVSAAMSKMEGFFDKSTPLQTMPSIPGGHPRGAHGPQTSSVSGNSQPNRTLKSKLSSIVNSNATVEEKMMLIAAVMADKLDEEAEKMMSKWSQDLNRTAHQGSHKGTQGTSGDDKSQQLEYLQMRLQQVTQKKNQLVSMASNVMKAGHSTKTAVISNMRV